MKEIWKDIKEYENLYMISNFGNVFSKKNKLILKQQINEKGYLRVTLSKSGKSKNYKVHRLVAQAFIPNTHNCKEINHIDGNKRNNCVDNLEWCTRSHNIKEAIKNKLLIPHKATKTSYQPVKVSLYDLNNNLIKTFPSMLEASKFYNCSVSTIFRYCNNQIICKKHIWRYADK